jgi:hypothetical protein
MVKSLADIWELVLRALAAPLLTLEDDSFEGDDHRDWLSNTIWSAEAAIYRCMLVSRRFHVRAGAARSSLMPS